MRLAPALGIIVSGLLLGGVIAAASRTRRPESQAAPAQPAPAPDERARHSGLAMVGELVVVTDANAFLGYVAASLGPEIPPDATAQDVLVRLLGDRFPDHLWPPERGAEAMRQWDFMVARIDELLHRGAPPPTPHRLHVVS